MVLPKLDEPLRHLIWDKNKGRMNGAAILFTDLFAPLRRRAKIAVILQAKWRTREQILISIGKRRL